MANGIGRVWAANAGDDEQRPNGVGSVWIENIEALTPSGGASEEQINELSAAIDYVSANAGDPNALTGYQEDGGEISSTSSLFEATGEGGYVINSNPGSFDASGHGHEFHVGEGGHLKANYSCSAVFTNGSNFINTNGCLISADGQKGFLVSAGQTHISATPYGLQTKNYRYDIKADDNGIDISANNGGSPIKYRNARHNITFGYQYPLDISSTNHSAWIDYNGAYGLSGSSNGTPYIGSYGKWNGPNGLWNVNGVGFSGINCNFGVYNAGTLLVSEQGKLSANNGASVIFTNGSQFEVTNGTTVGLSGTILQMNGGELYADSTTLRAGIRNTLNASGSRFVSADGEGVSAWTPDYMTVMGAYNQTSSNAAFVIGNGSGYNARSDLFVIDYSGNAQTNDFIAGNGAKLSDSIQTSELEFDGNDAITAINGSAIGGGQGEPYFESAVSSTQDFIVATEPVVHTVTGTMTTSFNIGDSYSYTPILSSEVGIDLTKATISVDLSNVDTGTNEYLYIYGDGRGWYKWENLQSFKQNFEQPFSTSSTLTGYSTSSEVDPTTLTAVSSININLEANTTIPYTATWVEEVAPKSLTGLYDSLNGLNNSFTAYTASVPNIQMVSTSSEATGTNILYVVTGSN